MLMPDNIDNEFFAPCGFNCFLCEKHLKEDNACPGCRISDSGKSKSSLKCKIKNCFDKKSFKYCQRCSEFPCKLIKKNDKNSLKRYGLSTIDNCKKLDFTGIGKIMSQDKEKYTCSECGGVISFNNESCSNCGAHFEGLNKKND
jgi:hypothetical protein